MIHRNLRCIGCADICGSQKSVALYNREEPLSEGSLRHKTQSTDFLDGRTTGGCARQYSSVSEKSVDSYRLVPRSPLRAVTGDMGALLVQVFVPVVIPSIEVA